MSGNAWDEHAANWDRDDAVRAYARAAFACLQRLERRGRCRLDGARILDFGCGTGLLTERFAPLAKRVVALDTSTSMIEILTAKATRQGWSNVDVLAASLKTARHDRPDLFGLPFDVVVASSVCAFLDDYPDSVRTLAGLLTPGGMFVQWDWEQHIEDGESVGLTRAQIASALADAGLTDLHVATAFTVEVDGEQLRPLVGYGNSGRRGR